MPIGFADPAWLWLALPALLVVVGGWLVAARQLPGGRRIASLVIRLALIACLVAVAGRRAARARLAIG